MIYFDFSACSLFRDGIRRLGGRLGFSESDSGIKVTAVEGDRIGVSLKDGAAVIYYREKCQFFRELGVLCENIGLSEFDITEDGYFTDITCMLDVSRGQVATVDTVKLLLDSIALMGYNGLLIYIEDLIKLEDYKYFGYMRGRYSPSEIKAMDDYANTYGIEIIPCLECYGHMEQYLFWDEAAPIKDTDRILLAREEKTFEFLDKLIGTVSGCVRSKRIHIGMDEAHGMGLGTFIKKHGYVPDIDIFNEYMVRLSEITDKYGLTPMMWNDMYFCASNKDGRYYSADTVISEETKAHIPKNMELVFWHYGEEPKCDGYMIDKCNALERTVIFAGGTWSWSGHCPEHHYMMETNRFSLDMCREKGVKKIMETLWYNEAECLMVCDFFGLSYVAELAYRVNPDKNVLKKRFETVSGGNYEAFLEMAKYHDTFNEGEAENYSHYRERFRGKPMFWQDIMEGIFDDRLYEKPLAAHYTACAENMRRYKGDAYEEEYMHTANIFAYLAEKCHIAERLVPAYTAGEREVLREIAETDLPKLKMCMQTLHESHRKLWHKYNKPFGFAVLETRYAGVEARCDTARMLINEYLDGKREFLEELEEPRLYKKFSGFIRHYHIAGPGTFKQ